MPSHLCDARASVSYVFDLEKATTPSRFRRQRRTTIRIYGWLSSETCAAPFARRTTRSHRASIGRCRHRADGMPSGGACAMILSRYRPAPSIGQRRLAICLSIARRGLTIVPAPARRARSNGSSERNGWFLRSRSTPRARGTDPPAKREPLRLATYAAAHPLGSFLLVNLRRFSRAGTETLAFRIESMSFISIRASAARPRRARLARPPQSFSGLCKTTSAGTAHVVTASRWR